MFLVGIVCVYFVEDVVGGGRWMFLQKKKKKIRKEILIVEQGNGNETNRDR